MKSTTSTTTTPTIVGLKSKAYKSLKILEIKKVLEKRNIKFVSNSKKGILIQMLLDNDSVNNKSNVSSYIGKSIKKRKQDDNDNINDDIQVENDDEEENGDDDTFLISSQLEDMEIDEGIKEIIMEDSGLIDGNGSGSGSGNGNGNGAKGGSNGKSKKKVNNNKKLKLVIEPQVVDFEKLFFKVFRSIVIRREISRQLEELCRNYTITFTDALDLSFHPFRCYLNTIIIKSTDSIMATGNFNGGSDNGENLLNSLIPYSVQNIKFEKGGVGLLSKLTFPTSVNTLNIADYKMEELHLPLSITNLTIGNTNSKFDYELNYIPPNVINLTIEFNAKINFHTIDKTNLKTITFPANYSSSVKSIPNSVDKLIFKKYDKRKVSKKYYKFIVENNN